MPFNTNFLNFSQSNLILLLSILVIPSLIAGPLITEIIVFLIITIFVMNHKFYKNLSIRYEKEIFVFFITFYIYINLNTAFNSVSIELSLKNTLFYFRFYFYIIVFFIIINLYKKKFFFYFYNILIFFLVFFFIDLIFLFFFDFSISGSEFYTQRFSSLFGDEQIMGSFVIKVLPSLLICLIYLEKNKYLILITILLGGILILASGERTAFVHFLILFFCLLAIKDYFKIIIISFTIFSTIFSLLYFFKFYPVNRIVNATISEYTTAGRDDIVIFSDLHENMILTSLEVFKNNFFFGTGAKTYRIVCSDKKYSSKIKEKIINENLFKAKEDGYFYVKKYNSINNVTLDNEIKYIANIFYDDGVNLKYEMYRYRLDVGLLSKAIKKIENNESNLIVSFKKGDIIGKINYQRLDGCDNHPHNLLAQIVSELGFFGLLFYVFFYGYLLKEFFKAHFKTKNIFLICYYLSIVSLLINFIPILPSGNFFNNVYSYLIYLPLCFFLFFRQKIKKTISTET